MASTWEDLLQLELQATGENSSTWGTRTNDNFERLADAIAGHESFSIAGSGDYTINQGTAVNLTFRRAFWTVTGILTGTRVLVVPASPKLYFIRNATTGGFGLTIKTAGGTAATIATSGLTIIVCDGTDCYTAADAVSRGGDTMTGKLTITSGGLAVDHAVSVSGSLYVGSTVSVSGAAAFGSTVSVSGAATFGSTVSIAGALDLNSTLLMDGAAVLNSTLLVGGIATFNSTVSVSGAATFKSTVSVSGAVSVGGALAVAGAATFGSTVSITGALDLNSTLLMDGAAVLNSTLLVGGIATFNSTVTVSGAAVFIGGVTFQAAVTVEGALVGAAGARFATIVSASSYAGANAIFASGTIEYAGAVSIEASFNVVSVTRSAQGNYRVSFTNAAPHARYAVLITPEATADNNAFIGWYSDRDTAGFNAHITDNSADNAFDPTGFSFLVVLHSLT